MPVTPHGPTEAPVINERLHKAQLNLKGAQDRQDDVLTEFWATEMDQPPGRQAGRQEGRHGARAGR